MLHCTESYAHFIWHGAHAQPANTRSAARRSRNRVKRKQCSPFAAPDASFVAQICGSDSLFKFVAQLCCSDLLHRLVAHWLLRLVAQIRCSYFCSDLLLGFVRCSDSLLKFIVYILWLYIRCSDSLIRLAAQIGCSWLLQIGCSYLFAQVCCSDRFVAQICCSELFFICNWRQEVHCNKQKQSQIHIQIHIQIQIMIQIQSHSHSNQIKIQIHMFKFRSILSFRAMYVQITFEIRAIFKFISKLWFIFRFVAMQIVHKFRSMFSNSDAYSMHIHIRSIFKSRSIFRFIAMQIHIIFKFSSSVFRFIAIHTHEFRSIFKFRFIAMHMHIQFSD